MTNEPMNQLGQGSLLEGLQIPVQPPRMPMRQRMNRAWEARVASWRAWAAAVPGRTTNLKRAGVVLAGLTVETCGEPAISIRRTAGNLLEIEFNGVLQHSENLTGWEDVDPQPLSPWTISPTTPRRFFRSRCQTE